MTAAAEPAMTRANKPLSRAGVGAVRWAAGLLALVLLPKCLVCLAAYTALAAGLRTLGVEWCASPSTPVSTTNLLALDDWSITGLALAICVAAAALRALHRRPPPSL